jgi:hypothetical protein
LLTSVREDAWLPQMPFVYLLQDVLLLADVVDEGLLPVHVDHHDLLAS